MSLLQARYLATDPDPSTMATYKDAGVDVEAGEAAVRRITRHVRCTFTPAVLTDVGAFGGLFALDAARYRQPVLVSSMDGVGTKLKVAQRVGRHDTVGEDLVNHCVNDIAVSGARPLFFLDYFPRARSSRTCSTPSCRASPRRAARTAARSSAARRPRCRTSTARASTTSPAPSSASSSASEIAGRGGDPGRRRAARAPSTGLHTNGLLAGRQGPVRALRRRRRARGARRRVGGRGTAARPQSYLDAIQALVAEGLASGFAHITGGGLVATRAASCRPGSTSTCAGTRGPSRPSSGSSRRSATSRGRHAADVQPRHRARRDRRPRRAAARWPSWARSASPPSRSAAS